MYYKGRVNERYNGWCYQSFSKCCQKYVFNLLIRAGVTVIYVSPGNVFPAHISLGMRVSPHTHIPRDPCFPLNAVSDMCFPLTLF